MGLTDQEKNYLKILTDSGHSESDLSRKQSKLLRSRVSDHNPPLTGNEMEKLITLLQRRLGKRLLFPHSKLLNRFINTETKQKMLANILFQGLKQVINHKFERP